MSESATSPASQAEEIPLVAPELRRLHPLTPIFRSWRAVGIATAAGVTGFRDDFDKLAWIWRALHGDAEIGVLAKAVLILVGVALAAIAVAWLSWRVTGFAIVADGHGNATLLVHRGLLVRQRSQVRLARVQSVDVNQPLVPRLCGLAVLRLEMAAGEDASFDLAYLRAVDAWQLREEILRYTTARGGDVQHPGQPPGSMPYPQPDRLVARISTRHLVLATLLAGAPGWVLLVLWVVGLVVFTLIFGVAGLVGAGAAVVPVSLAFAADARRQIRSILKDANFTLSRTATGIRVSSGLTSTINRTIDFDRIQGVRVEEPYLWRFFGWARVRVDVAGAKHDDLAASLMPVADRADALALVAEVTGEQIGTAMVSPPGAAARWLDPLGYRFLGLGLLRTGALTRTGRWRRRQFFVPYARVQSVSARQGLLQRRLGLATIMLDLPKGASRWHGRHRDVTDAADLVSTLKARARGFRAGAAPPRRWPR